MTHISQNTFFLAVGAALKDKGIHLGLDMIISTCLSHLSGVDGERVDVWISNILLEIKMLKVTGKKLPIEFDLSDRCGSLGNWNFIFHIGPVFTL